MADDKDMQRDEQRNGGQRPVPDPTVLTTEALQREIAALKELVEQRLKALQELVEARMDGMIAVREEEFRGVTAKLQLVETQRVEQKADTKLAVDAALSAQKEAVREQTTASERSIAKSEAATTKAIEQQGTTFTAALSGQLREANDLKERVARIEQTGAGQKESRERLQPFQVAVLGILGTGVVGGLLAYAANH